jgi:membrane associated rhomboid family serine protease
MNLMRNNNKPAKEPMLNIEEPAPLYLAVILVLAHLGFLLSPSSLQEVFYGASVLQAQNGEVFLTGRPVPNVVSLLTHTLVHGDWMHVGMNAGLIFAFGVLVTRATKNRQSPLLGVVKRGPAVFFLIFLTGAILGGLTQWAVWVLTDASGSAIGASTGGAALFAATGWALGGKQRMIGFVAVMMAIDAFSVLTGMSNPAWAGHLGGFIAGALLAPWLLHDSAVGLHFFR